MASVEARDYNGVWRQCPQWTHLGHWPQWVHWQSPWSGVRWQSPPEAVSLWAFGHQKEMSNLPTFPYFANSVVQTSADMIHYIAAARNGV